MKAEAAGNRACRVYGTLSANEALFALPQPQVLTEVWTYGSSAGSEVRASLTGAIYFSVRWRSVTALIRDFFFHLVLQRNCTRGRTCHMINSRKTVSSSLLRRGLNWEASKVFCCYCHCCCFIYFYFIIFFFCSVTDRQVNYSFKIRVKKRRSRSWQSCSGGLGVICT